MTTVGASVHRLRSWAVAVAVLLSTLVAGVPSTSMEWPGSQALCADVAVTVAVNPDHAPTADLLDYRITAGHSHGPPAAINGPAPNGHTYYVLAGETPVLVHNTGCGPGVANDAISDLGPFVSKTRGRVIDANGNDVGPRFVSGEGHPAYNDINEFLTGSPHIPNPPSGPHPSASHVETQYAWWMRNNGVTDADVVVNNPRGVCPLPFGCQAAVPAILPAGSTMRVWYPGATQPVTLGGLG